MNAPLDRAASRAHRPCLFGGSFDPIHEGHLFAARAARERFDLDHAVFVPAAAPPHKPGVVLAEPHHRVAMLELALEGEDAASIWTEELERGGKSYTIDTVRTFLEARKGTGGLHLLIGGDNLAGLRDWREVETLLELVQPVVVHRGEETRGDLALLAEFLGESALAKLEAGLIELPPCPISATEIRARVGCGEPIDDQVPGSVAEYIAVQGIYRLS